MAFDPTWEIIFSQREWGKYPDEDVIRFVAKNFYSAMDRRAIKILDLGCGGGAHTLFMAKEGFDVYGIDGSFSAIAQTQKRLAEENLHAQLKIGDIKDLPYEHNFFDAVVDCNTIQHNPWISICAIYDEIWRVLKPSGMFLSKMVSTGTTGYENAQKIEENTYRGFKSNVVTSNVLAHLFTCDEVIYLTKDKLIEVNHLTRTLGQGTDCIAHMIVSAQKKKTKYAANDYSLLKID